MRTCGLSGAVLGALAVVAMCSITVTIWFVQTGQSPGGVRGGLRQGDRAMVELALDKYRLLARNVTRRVEAAELALKELKKQAARAPAPQQEEKPPRDPRPAEDTAGDAAPFDAGSEEDPEEDETEEERAKRQQEEESEQRALIQYDEAKGTFRRWRGDYRCADKVPLLPDGEAVECAPGFAAPCCSALGWCGRSAAHCSCDMCSDYRSKVKISFQKLKLDKSKRECETIAANLGEFKNPEACAKLAMDDPQCGQKIMFAKHYPEWGCRCCALDTPAGSDEKPEWNVYHFEVTEEIL
mmetsp:Transcript_58330/g.103654  ORF Transcript_58330/g.103654 Transcript_58330/m.103654 type:complete len:297 (+) Transcript_58330:100-990(+)